MQHKGMFNGIVGILVVIIAIAIAISVVVVVKVLLFAGKCSKYRK